MGFQKPAAVGHVTGSLNHGAQTGGAAKRRRGRANSELRRFVGSVYDAAHIRAAEAVTRTISTGH